jgi:hypothetical protein
LQRWGVVYGSGVGEITPVVGNEGARQGIDEGREHMRWQGAPVASLLPHGPAACVIVVAIARDGFPPVRAFASAFIGTRIGRRRTTLIRAMKRG